DSRPDGPETGLDRFDRCDNGRFDRTLPGLFDHLFGTFDHLSETFDHRFAGIVARGQSAFDRGTR
ncbi:hypothetical protein, partial [Halorubrum sp. AJ67]|uniref:hypothetical protein n=1 Tax=Halorubrum sp. AJ67 TaxID=1173487 RepID=UPI00064E50C4